MHPLKKIVATRVLALLLVATALWQQQQTAAKADAAPSDSPWQAPLAAPLHLINPYFQPNSDYSAGHRGVDYRVTLDDEIYAPTDATVWFVGKVVDRPVVSLRTKSGDLLEFEPACSALAAGDQVTAGQTIASVCQADPGYKQHCQGQLCLHFSLRTDRGYLSPLVRFGSLSPTVLLPEN